MLFHFRRIFPPSLDGSFVATCISTSEPPGWKLSELMNWHNDSPTGKVDVAASDSAKHNERRLNLLISDIECTNLPAMDSAAMGGVSDSSYESRFALQNKTKNAAPH